MKVSNNRMVTVTYDLTYDDANGELIEQTTKNNPLSFIYGIGNMLQHFEANLKELETGDKFEFTLTADKAYGEIEKDAIVELPLHIFEIDGKIDYNLLKTGNTVPMMDNQGNRLNGIVRMVNEKFVSMDFNHPLAGEDLHFKGEIIEVREATQSELDEALSGGNCSTDDCGSCGCGCH